MDEGTCLWSPDLSHSFYRNTVQKVALCSLLCTKPESKEVTVKYMLVMLGGMSLQ